MTKKVLKKKAPAQKSVTKLAEPVLDSARDIWLAGLGAFSMAQRETGKIAEQGTKLFDKLVSEGKKLEADTRKVAEASVAEVRGKVSGVRGEVESKVDSAKQQVRDNWDKLETLFEDRVARVLGRLGVPTADDVRKMTQRVEALAARVGDLALKPKAKEGAVNAYHLIPNGSEWAVRREGNSEDIAVHPTKNAALDAARGIAKAHEPSRLVVHKADGTIQTSYNYGEGA